MAEHDGAVHRRRAAGTPGLPQQRNASDAGPPEDVDAAARRLIGTAAAENTPAIAAELQDLSVILAQLGRTRESIDAAERAVRMYRTLGGGPHLASALTNLGNRSARLGDWPAALTAFEEAARI